jgi:hypothetical protein
MGPIPNKEASQLHITNLVHGSFGFLLEELDQDGEPLFESPLKKAADEVSVYLAGFADPDEKLFTQVIEEIHPRVFTSLKNFFGTVYKEKGTFRIVEGERDKNFDSGAVERAWFRAEHSNVDQDEPQFIGRLLGVIPIKRRFEFEPDNGAKIIEGKVGDEFSQSYLEKIGTEQFAGKRWRAFLKRRLIEKPGRSSPIERYTLLKLEEIEEDNSKQ